MKISPRFMKFLGVIIDEYLLYVNDDIFQVSSISPLSFPRSRRKEPDIKKSSCVISFYVNSRQAIRTCFYIFVLLFVFCVW